MICANHIETEAGGDLELTLVCCSDQKFAMPLAVLLCSAAANISPPWRIRMCVIDGGMTPATIEHLRKTASRLANAQLRNIPSRSRGPRGSTYRPTSQSIVLSPPPYRLGSPSRHRKSHLSRLRYDRRIQSRATLAAGIRRRNHHGRPRFRFPNAQAGNPRSGKPAGNRRGRPVFQQRTDGRRSEASREERISEQVLEYTRPFQRNHSPGRPGRA